MTEAKERWGSLLSEILDKGLVRNKQGGRGGGNFKFGFGNEVTHPCTGSEIC